MDGLSRTLEDLIATCRESEEGFGKAAEGVHSQSLRNRFTGIALQRAWFAEELRGHLVRLGVESPAAGHDSGAQHRGWSELETGIRSKDDATFLSDCEKGEETALNRYERALTQDLPREIRPVVERHRLAVQEALLGLRSVEQLRKAS